MDYMLVGLFIMLIVFVIGFFVGLWYGYSSKKKVGTMKYD